MSNKIEDLEPELREQATTLLAEAARHGLLLRITHTRRTFQEQEDIYAQGRTKPGPKVTAAAAGWSAHNYGLAFDVCQHGGEPYPDNDDWWEKVGRLGESLGLEWGGRWKHPDRPHFQLLGGRTLAQLRADAVSRGDLLA